MQEHFNIREKFEFKGENSNFGCQGTYSNSYSNLKILNQIKSEHVSIRLDSVRFQP